MRRIKKHKVAAWIAKRIRVLKKRQEISRSTERQTNISVSIRNLSDELSRLRRK